MANLTRRIAVLLVMALSIGMGLLFAQSDRGTITGEITDSSGARVAGASINVTATLTGLTVKVLSNADGIYTVSSLPIGQYSVSVEHPGFKKYSQQGITLNNGETLGIDVVLQVGNVTETVQVTGEAPQLEAESTSVATTATSTLVQDLPLESNGEMRNPAFFMNVDSTVSSRGNTNGGGGGFNARQLSTTIAGSQSAAAEFHVDGAALTGGGSFGSEMRLIGFPQDAVSEFNLYSVGMPAEYGHAGQGVMAFTLKSGTNQMHGSAYEYFRNSALDSRGHFNSKVPALHQNEFGATFGTHIIKDKLFVFGWYDGFRQAGQASNSLTTIPYQAEKQGDFSNFRNTPTGPVIPIYNPYTNAPDGAGGVTRTAFTGNVISDHTLFDPVALAYNPLFPNPSGPNANAQYNNYLLAGVNGDTINNFGTKVDFQMSTKNRLSGDFGWSKNNILTTPTPFSGALSEGGISNFKQPMGRLSDDYLISSNVVNHITIGFNRWATLGLSQTPQVAGGWPAKLGYKGVPWTDGEIPIINGFDGTGQFGGGGGLPSGSIYNNTVVSENLTWVKGKHTLKFGMDWIREGVNSFGSGRASGYLFTSNKFTGLPDSGGANYGVNNGSGYASWLLGMMESGQTLNPVATNLGGRGGYWAGYTQDDWKVSSKLTANLGVRWDMYEPPIEVHNNMVWMTPTLVNPLAGGILGAAQYATPQVRSGTRSSKHDFSPRIGLAYAVNNKTVVRASFGIIFGPGGFFGTDNTNFSPGSLDYEENTGNNDLTPTWRMQDGWPALSPSGNPWPLTLTRTPGFNLGARVERLDPTDSKPSYMLNRVFQIERQLPSNMLFKIAYVGNHGTRLQSRIDVNDEMPPWDLSLVVPNTKGVLVPAFDQPFSSDAVQALQIVKNMPTVDPATGHHTPYLGFEAQQSSAVLGQALKPFPQYTTMRRLYEGDGKSDYNALRVDLNKRMSNGLTLLVSYTWSKVLTNAASQFSEFSGYDLNSYNARTQRGLSINDYPQNLVLTYSYELPFGKGKKFANTGGIANAIIGGWKVSGVQNYQSGPPQYVDENCDLGNGNQITGNSDNGGGQACRPNMVPGVPLRSSQRDQPGYDGSTMPSMNVNAFALTPTPHDHPGLAYQSYFGNMPVLLGGAGRRPPYFNEDISLIKKTQITERVNVEIRADFLNIFNRTVLGFGTGGDMYGSSLNNNITSGTFGVTPEQSNFPREIQFGLKINY